MVKVAKIKKQDVRVRVPESGHDTTSGPAKSVRLLRFWPDQFFHQGKSKISFLQTASNKQRAIVILGLIKLIILNYNR